VQRQGVKGLTKSGTREPTHCGRTKRANSLREGKGASQKKLGPAAGAVLETSTHRTSEKASNQNGKVSGNQKKKEDPPLWNENQPRPKHESKPLWIEAQRRQSGGGRSMKTNGIPENKNNWEEEGLASAAPQAAWAKKRKNGN